MKVHFREFRVKTNKGEELVDITHEVEDSILESGIRDGICIVYTVHSTAGIVVNELEHGLMADMTEHALKLYPKAAGYLHDRIDSNANAHLASAFIGSSRIFPVRGGKLLRGIWQNIFLLEMDGPRDRKIIVEILGLEEDSEK